MVAHLFLLGDRLGRLLLKLCLAAGERLLHWLTDAAYHVRPTPARSLQPIRTAPTDSQVSLSGVIVTLLAAVAFVIFWATSSTGQNNAFVSFLAASAPPTPELAELAPPTAIPTPEPDPRHEDVMVFSMRHGAQYDLFALQPGSPGPIRLTTDPEDDRTPAISPDGSTLAFSSRRDGNWELYTMDLATGEITRVTYDLAYESAPSWSPDGLWLAYEATYAGNLNIYIIRADGSEGPYQVTHSPYPDYAPAWSPDPTNRQIAYVSLREEQPDIFLLSLDDPSEARALNVTNSPNAAEDAPRWSPDGSRLAFTAVEDGTSFVYTVDVRADVLVPVASGQGIAPTWSPDGQQLAYFTERSGGTLITTVQFDGWESAAPAYLPTSGARELDWTGSTPPLITQRANEEVYQPVPVYEERLVAQPRPGADPPYRVVNLEPLGIIADSPYLSDRVDGSFSALREHVKQAAGWDVLGQLDSLFWDELAQPAAPGQDFRNWHKAGRAFDVMQSYNEGNTPEIELVSEPIGPSQYWRMYVRCAVQDGSCGEPLRRRPWDFQARFSGDVVAYENGGRLKDTVPSGYYIDFTELAALYGWERVPSSSSWRYNWTGVLYWQYEKRDGLDWWSAMRELYAEPGLLEVFGPPTQAVGQ
ncbi:MAG: hypothetical protein GX484_19135 [Chloroflexi bacterium]|nr:hypothetical protein [Chloroflexota bacterium]